VDGGAESLGALGLLHVTDVDVGLASDVAAPNEVNGRDAVASAPRQCGLSDDELHGGLLTLVVVVSVGVVSLGLLVVVGLVGHLSGGLGRHLRLVLSVSPSLVLPSLLGLGAAIERAHSVGAVNDVPLLVGI
jgi:hypothetical protein